MKWNVELKFENEKEAKEFYEELMEYYSVFDPNLVGGTIYAQAEPELEEVYGKDVAVRVMFDEIIETLGRIMEYGVEREIEINVERLQTTDPYITIIQNVPIGKAYEEIKGTYGVEED